MERLFLGKFENFAYDNSNNGKVRKRFVTLKGPLEYLWNTMVSDLMKILRKLHTYLSSTNNQWTISNELINMTNIIS